MKEQSSKSLTDLPPELFNHILAYLPNAAAVAKLSTVNKALHSRIEETGWKAFSQGKFPHQIPTSARSGQSIARSLTSLSRAWDRRAIVVRSLAPDGLITTFPGAKQVSQWQAPKGQTMGFVPVLDAYAVNDDTEVLAFSAGAQVCVRKKHIKRVRGVKQSESSTWSTYRPVSAAEGRDDVTAMQLIHHNGSIPESGQQVITGTANGDLQHITIPTNAGQDSKINTYFTTQGLAVKSLSVDQSATKVAAVLGLDNIAVFPVDPSKPKTAPISQLSVRLGADGQKEVTSQQFSARVARFVSSNKLAVGVGPDQAPLRVYDVLPTGLDPSHMRSFGLFERDLSERVGSLSFSLLDPPSQRVGSIYAIHPAPESPHLIYTGAYDRTIRLHDLRSSDDFSMGVYDWLDDSAVYSLLPKGPHMLLAGTNRHNILKMFDIRRADRPYSYVTTPTPEGNDLHHGKCRLYLSREFKFAHPNGVARRFFGSSIYSLASMNQASPTIFAGMQDGILELAFSEMLHPHPDRYHFKPWRGPGKQNQPWDGWRLKHILDVARAEREILERQRSLDATVSVADHQTDSPFDFRWTKAQNSAATMGQLSVNILTHR